MTAKADPDQYGASVTGAEQEPLLAEREDEQATMPAVDLAAGGKKEHRAGDYTLEVITFAGLLLFLVTTWFLVFSHNPYQLGYFAFHPTLQSLSIALFTLGILQLQPTATPQSKALGLTRHQIIQLTGFSTITVGVTFMFINKIVIHHHHFETWHGVFGLIAYIWLIVQSAFGGLSVWFGGKAFGGLAKAKATWKFHRASGYVLLVWLFVTAYLAGEWSDWANNVSGPVLRASAYVVAPLMVVIGVGGRTRLWKMKLW